MFVRRLVSWRWSMRLVVALIAGCWRRQRLDAAPGAAKRPCRDRAAVRSPSRTGRQLRLHVHLPAHRPGEGGRRLEPGRRRPSGPFAAATTAFGFQAAVLLDSTGRAADRRTLLRCRHRQTARHSVPAPDQGARGRIATSDVIRSVVLGLPAVAFAVPFATPQGRRVLSGAYLVSDTPLAAFLSDTTAVQGAQLYLTDSTGKVIAKNGQAATASAGIQSLAQVAPTSIEPYGAAAQTVTTRWGRPRTTRTRHRVPELPGPC